MPAPDLEQRDVELPREVGDASTTLGVHEFDGPRMRLHKPALDALREKVVCDVQALHPVIGGGGGQLTGAAPGCLWGGAPQVCN